MKTVRITFFLMVILFLGSGLNISHATSNKQPLSTTAMAFDKSGENIFLVQKTAKRVDLVSRKDAQIIYQWHFTNEPTGIVVNANKAYITSSYGNGLVSVINIITKEVTAEIEVPMGAISPVLNTDGTILYVCCQFDNTLVEIDLTTNSVKREVKLLREPKGAVLSADGDFVYVTNFLPNQRADLEVVASKVSVVNTRTMKRINDIQLANGSNALRGICLSPDGKYVFITHNLGRFQVPTTQLQQGWMNTSGMSIINTSSQAYMGTIILDEPESGAAGIWEVACDEETMVISHSGTHDISVINYPELIQRFENTDNKEELSYDLRFLSGIRKRIPIEGNGPRALLLDTKKVIVASYFSDQLNIINLNNHSNTVFALNPNYTESLERKGERIFNDASHCFQGWQSCNGCHPGDARTDGMNWDLLNDGIGNSKNCKSLLLSHQTPPAMISGIRPDAETAVRAGFKHIQFAEVSEEDAQAVDAYLKSLQPLPSPYLINGKLSNKAERGKKVFQKAGCNYCHSGPFYTDLSKHKIGPIEFENGWDTTTLREVWRTAPYLFDGRAESIEVLIMDMKHGLEGRKLKKKELEDLVEYIKSL